jgi:hypothetical protein
MTQEEVAKTIQVLITAAEQYLDALEHGFEPDAYENATREDVVNDVVKFMNAIDNDLA